MTQLPMALPAPPARSQPLYVSSAERVEFGAGFHEEEAHVVDRFRWMSAAGVLRFPAADVPRFLELWVLSEFHDLSQSLDCRVGGSSLGQQRLVAGWAPLSVSIPPAADHVELAASKALPRTHHPADARTLAVRVRPPLLHRDATRHEHIRRQHDNSVRNVTEMLEGRAALDSTPVNLGIDLYGVCNVKPPCVYCEWDLAKSLEGSFVDAPFTTDTLREWGPFFDNSVSLVNCSIGEPFMMKEFDDLLDAFGHSGKVLEMTTNGQILTDKNIQKLLGRPIDLYVSLDAATPETYAKLRNDRFNQILHNLRRLITAKGGVGQLPRVHLVFMPMRVNVHEMEAFVRLCADLQADRLVLRPLNDSPSVTLDWERAGYRFDYQHELLPFDQLVRASGRVAELCGRLGVALADQMDFGGAMGEQFDAWFEEGRRSVASSSTSDGESSSSGDGEAIRPAGVAADAAPPAAAPAADAAPAEPAASLGHERVPACTEPWKSLYILRRGVLPCCYGAFPIAPMDQYRDVWNGPTVQAIRSELSQGRFHEYCLRSTACPIVRKSVQAKALPLRDRAVMKARRLWFKFDRMTYGYTGRIQRALFWTGARVARAAVDPAYVAHHSRRLFTGSRSGSFPKQPPSRLQ